ncbi:MAG: hypothetical protein Q7J60_25980, partial [Bradyrhizobium sp.]|nr:hypothetical protein [Bradyrhizobium sp.]
QAIYPVIARSPCDEAIHSFFARMDGLLRCARNDVERAGDYNPRNGENVSDPRSIRKILLARA